jgi:formylglycine-generating enzyme required for sulfatase activity
MVLDRGTFQMGSGTTPFDRPPHRVTIGKPFAIGVNEVTFDEWNACQSDGGCAYKPDDQGFGGGLHPVINVSWSDAHDYLAWLSRRTGKTYRLPSEAEWEYAAHGGTSTPYSWGVSIKQHMANCADCGAGLDSARTVEVRHYPANGFGLFDMAGNAAEWVEDCWHQTYRGAPKDGSAWLGDNCSQRVLRGGSFDSAAAYAKPSARFRYDADVRYWANGFRVARDVP